MKKHLLWLLILFSYTLYAKKVEIKEAKEIAKNYFSTQLQQIKKHTKNDVKIIETIYLNRKSDSLIYVFNFEKGFVMMSAHDEHAPFFGFSLEGKFDIENLPAALVDLLEVYKDQVSNSVKHKSNIKAGVSEEWELYSSKTNARVAKLGDIDCEVWPKFYTKDPLLATTWGEGCNFNKNCPYDSRARGSCERAPAGCAASAMAQVMKYWNYPATGTGSHGYTDLDDGDCPGSYGYQFANFGGTTYNWAAMTNDVGNDAISTLMYHCGVSIEMNYGYNCSVINKAGFQDRMPYALINYFRYSSTTHFIMWTQTNDPYWEGYLTTELDNNRPIIFVATPAGGRVGHTFVLDGYTKAQTECCTYSALFHVNFGEHGSSDGYYFLGNMQGYNYAQAAIIGIKPNTYSYPVPAAPNSIGALCYTHCRFDDVDYFVPSVLNATSYEWQITGLYGVQILPNGRYATISSHRYGTGTLWCRALNCNGTPGPWCTTPLVISNCMGASKMDKDSTITDIQVYPNPAADKIHINLPDYENYSKVELMDMQGKVIQTVLINNKTTIMETGEIKNGLYLLKLTSGQKTELRKVSIIK